MLKMTQIEIFFFYKDQVIIRRSWYTRVSAAIELTQVLLEYPDHKIRRIN